MLNKNQIIAGIDEAGRCPLFGPVVACAVIFNEDTSGDTSVLVLDFGADKTSTAGDFTIAFPTADASDAIIRIA